MESIDELNATFQQLITLASGVETVILADQGRAAPTGLYATYKPIPVRAYGQSGHKLTDIAPVEEFDDSLGDDWTDLQDTVFTSMEFMLSVNILNEGADTAIMRLHTANFRYPVSVFLHESRIAWRYVSNARTLTGLMQAGLQSRWQADINLFINHTISYPVLRAAGFTLNIQNY